MKIEKLFSKADGGVIFIDEAGFLNDKSDAFVCEAVIELVRYMEKNPQTVVIFATYSEEADKLLEVDPGFKSRIEEVVHFSDYSVEELYQILKKHAEDARVELSEEVKPVVCAYFRQRRKKKNFGNGREVRRMLEQAMEEYAVECVDEGVFFRKNEKVRLEKRHFEQAVKRILQNEKIHASKEFLMGYTR